jgi:membrane protein YqaA with SNARE-associated domain
MYLKEMSMSKTERKDPPDRFLEVLKTSWVKSSIALGIITLAIGLIMNFGSTQLFLDVKALVTDYGLVGIFFATILAGTVVPLGSPALVVAAALFGVPQLPLTLIATIGFTIGMAINYSLAYYLGRPYVMRKLAAEKLEEMTHLWSRWGWILYTVFGLIPILPVELLSFVCGFLKTRLDIFLLLSFLPRLVVFAILAYFGEQAAVWLGIT